jgi:hypothetical protein
MPNVRIILPLACLALGACVPVDRGFGETVRLNSIRQTVNPDGVEPSPEGPMEGGNAKRADSAVERYEGGAVAQPKEESTQSGGGGGS